MAADQVYINASAEGLEIEGVAARLAEEGSTWGLEDSAIVQESDSGLEVVIERWPRRRHKGILSWGPGDAAVVIENLFEVNGKKYSWLFIPPRARHYTVTEHWFASGDGSEDTFQLNRGVATTDPSDDGVRAVIFNVYYPIDDDFLDITVDGTPVGFTLGARGIVVLDDPPANAAIIRASFHYATPVRFSSESIDITMREVGIDEVRSASIVEVFE